jgi:hypothetical protein
VLVQYGFLLGFAVLLDTFVVRTALVPALLHLAGNYNWWPGRMPVPTLTVDDFVEIEGEAPPGVENDSSSQVQPDLSHKRGSDSPDLEHFGTKSHDVHLAPHDRS